MDLQLLCNYRVLLWGGSTVCCGLTVRGGGGGVLCDNPPPETSRQPLNVFQYVFVRNYHPFIAGR